MLSNPPLANEGLCELPDSGSGNDDALAVLQRYRTIAVIGMSRDPDKPSHAVARFLREHGYRMIPVDPQASGELLGERVYTRLSDIPDPVEIVQIFRPGDDVPKIIEDAIAIRANAVWMQEGISHREAAMRTRQAGLAVIMDRCMMKVLQAAAKRR